MTTQSDLQVICPACEARNPVTNRFCGKCGHELAGARVIQPARQPGPKPAPTPEKKSAFSQLRGAILIVGAVVVIACVGILIVTSAVYDPDLAATGEARPAATATATPSLADLQASAIDVSYEDLARNTDAYEGQMVHFRGKVVQVVEQWGADMLRVYVTEGEYSWDDQVLITYDDDWERLLEDDIVEFWGIVAGRQSYETVLGATVTAPKIDTKVCERVGRDD